ncbi:hypothetical protein ACEPAI_1639 [Sanghuangporus weigelae]
MAEDGDNTDDTTYTCDWLSSRLNFNISFDAKLAAIYLNGVRSREGCVLLFDKILEVVRDPDFKLDQVTFNDIESMSDHISKERRKNASMKDIEYLLPPTEKCPPRFLPEDILSLIVDFFVDERKPLGILSTAHVKDGKPFWLLSLVHRSWTRAAQNGLRRRAIIPYLRMDKFLLSPLCGPWVTETIVSWTVEGKDDATEDFCLFEMIL